MKKSQIIYSYLLVYLLLLFHAGFVFTESYSRYTNILLVVLTAIYLIIFKKKIARFTIFFSITTIILQLFTFILKGLPEPNFYISSVVDIITAAMIVSAIDIKIFKHIFSDINFVICIASLIFFLLFTYNVPLEIFPVIINSNESSAYFAFLTSSRIAWVDYRIQGIYWEPGAFQFFLIISALIDMYNIELTPRNRNLRFFVFLITLFFTYSTTGIICSLFVISLYLYKFNKKPIIVLSLFWGILFFIIIGGIIIEDSYLYYTLFGKLSALNDSFQYGESGNETADTRMGAVVYVVEEFLKSPIVGIGLSGHEALARRGLNLTTFTPISLFAEYGIFLGLFHMIGLLKLMLLQNKRVVEACLVLAASILCTISEQFAFNPILMCFSLYGYIGFKFSDVGNIYRKKMILYGT